jgi:hypothetical protein
MRYGKRSDATLGSTTHDGYIWTPGAWEIIQDRECMHACFSSSISEWGSSYLSHIQGAKIILLVSKSEFSVVDAQRLVLGWLNSFGGNLQGVFFTRSPLWLNPAPLRIHLCIRSLVSLASPSSVLIGSKPVLFIQTGSLAKTCSGFLGKQLSFYLSSTILVVRGWNSVLESLVSNLLVAVSLIVELSLTLDYNHGQRKSAYADPSRGGGRVCGG